MADVGYHARSKEEPNQICALDWTEYRRQDRSDLCPSVWFKMTSGRDAVTFGAEGVSKPGSDGGWMDGSRLGSADAGLRCGIFSGPARR